MKDPNHPRNWTPEQRRQGLRDFMEEIYRSQHDKPLSTPEELAAINAEFDRPLTDEERAKLVREHNAREERRRHH